MKVVSRFEARMLRVLQGVFRRGPREQALAQLFAGDEQPPCLSRAAIELLQDYLGKGCVHLLARAGWRHERFLAAGQLRTGRLWQRTAAADIGLVFSRQSIEFLFWLVGPAAKRWEPRVQDLTLGDRFLFVLAYQALRDAEAAKPLRQHGYFALDGLCRLTFPEDASKALPDWTPWTSPPGSCILEAWQEVLANRWQHVEQTKGNLVSPTRMRELGENQTVVLKSFLAALEQAERRDLAQFLLRAFGRLLTGAETAQTWIAKLMLKELRLADRTMTYRAALAPLEHLKRLQDWERQARTVGYFEENYAASQLWKSLWEEHRGDDLCAHAERILAEVEPLKPV